MPPSVGAPLQPLWASFLFPLTSVLGCRWLCRIASRHSSSSLKQKQPEKHHSCPLRSARIQQGCSAVQSFLQQGIIPVPVSLITIHLFILFMCFSFNFGSSCIFEMYQFLTDILNLLEYKCSFICLFVCLMCVGVFPACISVQCVHANPVPAKSKRGHQIPWSWSFRQLQLGPMGAGNQTLLPGDFLLKLVLYRR